MKFRNFTENVKTELNCSPHFHTSIFNRVRQQSANSLHRSVTALAFTIHPRLHGIEYSDQMQEETLDKS
jgi:hypothetical protein